MSDSSTTERASQIRQATEKAAEGSNSSNGLANPHSLTGEQIQDRLAGDGFDTRDGLSTEFVEKNRAKFGRNEIEKPERASLILQFLMQFANPFVGALLAAAVVAVVVGIFDTGGSKEPIWTRFSDAAAILLIVIANAVLGLSQERRAEKALDALEKLSSPLATVIRDGKSLQIPASEVVVGDLLKLEAGDRVPADARLLAAHGLAADESALTGESEPVQKDARDVAPEDAPIAERPSMIFLGTSLTAGAATAVVCATGARTELGKIGALMASAGDSQTPLEKNLASFGQKILYACLLISVFLFAYGIFFGTKKWPLLLLEAVSLAVAAIPEGLPAITTITLALGMQRMAERGAQVRKLPAVETLGCASVICSDKTGTLTQNAMTVREAWAGGVKYRVTGQGYSPEGSIVRADLPQNSRGSLDLDNADVPLERLLRTAALCNNAHFVEDEDGQRKVIGDPTEGALLVMAEKGQRSLDDLMPETSIIGQVPFDSDRKRMTVVTLDARGRHVAHVKGSLEVLLPRCIAVKMGATITGDVSLDDPKRREIIAVAEDMASRALRVLALARRRQPGGDPEDQLTLLGLVGIIDPPRPSVKKAIAMCADAGLHVAMITGDHKLTAIAIAKELGIWGPNAKSLLGSEVAQASDADLAKLVSDVRVFARVSPEHKLRIVRAFKANGHVVAMTGDGVNDAPAIREAQIGLAMGIGGTDVAREAADLVLLDNNFATIVEAIRQGRAIYNNIQKSVYFLLSSNAGLCFAVFASAIFPWLPSLTPLQILWINLVTNGLPALALGVDPPEPDQMKRKPRPVSSGLLHTYEYLGILYVGLVMGATSIAVMTWGALTNHLDESRTMAFAVLAISPLFHSFNCRSSTLSIARIGVLSSRPLLMATFVSGLIELFSLLVPGLDRVFHTTPLSLIQWLVLLALSALIIPAAELQKLVRHLAERSSRPNR